MHLTALTAVSRAFGLTPCGVSKKGVTDLGGLPASFMNKTFYWEGAGRLTPSMVKAVSANL